MRVLRTASNHPVHPIGIGTWNIASRSDPAKWQEKYRGVEPVYGNEDQEIAAIRYSLGKGQNHIHCAELYGGFYTDEVIGRAIAEFARKDLYISDTLWKSSIGPGEVRPTVNKMLQKLGTDYLDLLYIHAPWQGVECQAAIPQIDELIDEGIVRHFGVSNFGIAHMQQAMTLAKHPIVANQMNFNVLYKDEVDQAFRQFCRQHDIQIVAYQPLKRQEVLTDSIVQQIASAHQAAPAQVALAWLLRTGALPIPKATDLAHIDENLGALDLELTEQDMAKLDALT